MLQMEYQNSYNHNYLKLKAKWEQGGKMRYQYRILTLRNPQGLLRTDTYSEDGESGLRYDISSKQSLDKYFLKGRITTPWMEELEAVVDGAVPSGLSESDPSAGLYFSGYGVGEDTIFILSLLCGRRKS